VGGPAPHALTSEWVRVDGRSLHARVTTESAPLPKPTLVLVHGFGGSSRSMLPLADRLRVLWQVAAPDLPGFGLTPPRDRALDISGLADVLCGWMHASGRPRAVRVGLSFGCQVIVDLAVRRPEMAAALVLAGPTVDPRRRTLLQQSARWLWNAAGEPAVSWRLLARDYADAGLPLLVGTLRHMLADAVEDKLTLVEAPALVVRGGRDPLVSQAWAREAAGRLPDGRLEVVAGARHALTTNSPSALAAATSRFLLERAGDVGVEWPPRPMAA
jgi:pimeloyl-ACP methyl ester carboxylesterase